MIHRKQAIGSSPRILLTFVSLWQNTFKSRMIYTCPRRGRREVATFAPPETFIAMTVGYKDSSLGLKSFDHARLECLSFVFLSPRSIIVRWWSVILTCYSNLLWWLFMPSVRRLTSSFSPSAKVILHLYSASPVWYQKFACGHADSH
jgi:hypothetical protein